MCFDKVKVYNLYRRRWLHYELAAAVFRLSLEGAAVASAMELLPVCSCRVRSRLSSYFLLDSCAIVKDTVDRNGYLYTVGYGRFLEVNHKS